MSTPISVVYSTNYFHAKASIIKGFGALAHYGDKKFIFFCKKRRPNNLDTSLGTNY